MASSDEWGTPQELFDILHREFRFDVDACATASNAKCPLFMTQERCAFRRHLTSPMTVWMNPPFSRIAEALLWARQQSQNGSTVVVMVPTRTNPPWWHEHVLTASEIRFILHKVAFVLPRTFEEEIEERYLGVPFTGHAIVVFRPNDHSRKILTQFQRIADQAKHGRGD